MKQICTAGGQLVWDHLAVLHTEFEKNNVELQAGFHKQFSKTYPGGCIGNIASAMRHLGIDVELSCLAGSLDADTKTMAELKKSYGTLRKIIWNSEREFGHCYQIYDVAHNKISIMDELMTAVQEDAYAVNPGDKPLLCLALPQNNQQVESLVQLILRTKQQGFPVALSMISSPGIYSFEMLENADYIFMNTHENDILKRQYHVEHPIKKLLSQGLTAAFVTEGAAGSRVYEKNHPDSSFVPAVTPERIVDTTGAGDGYAGGTMAGLLLGYNCETAAKIGAVVSSYVLEQLGAQTGQPDWTLMEYRYVHHFGKLEAQSEV